MSKVRFKANARIKDVVGRELINDDNIAIAELVKNSIDADASNVHIIFQGAKDKAFGPGESASIIIADDGAGMDDDDMRNKWLNIAYSEKRGGASSKKFLAGNKGIGRFSCDRLGKLLNLYTQKHNNPVLSMKIDWDIFNAPKIDEEIGSFELNLDEMGRYEFDNITSDLPIRKFHSGCILEIGNLHSMWDRKKILALRRLLEKMVNPHESMLANPKCKIHIHASPLKGLSGVVKNSIFDKLKFKTTSVESRISKDGKIIVTEIKDKGQTIVKITTGGESAPYPALKNSYIRLYYMNRYKKALFKRQTGVSTTEFGSVFMFLNGFRVPPYGDRGDDWLALDNRKTQGTMRHLGTRDLLGVIEIKDADNNFQVLSSREGVVNNDAYQQLINVDRSGTHVSYGGHFYDILSRLEAYVVDGLDWDSLPKGMTDREVDQILEDGKEEVYKVGRSDKDLRILDALHKIVASPKQGDIIEVEISPSLLPRLRREEKSRVSKIFNYLKTLSDKGALASNQTQALSQIHEHIHKQEQRIQKLSVKRDEAIQKAEQAEAQATVEKSRRMFLERRVTPEMQGVWNMSHQMIIKIGTLQHNIQRIFQEAYNQMPQRAQKRLVRMRREIDELSVLCRYITNKSFQDAYSELSGDIPEFIRGYVSARKHDKLIGGMQLLCDPQITFSKKFSPMDLTIVLDNLIDNTRKASKMRDLVHTQYAPNITIEITLSKGEGDLLITFSDKSGGLDASIVALDSIFELGFTTTDGMGLGLHIVKEVVEKKMYGKITCSPSNDGLKFLIRIPKS